MERKIPRFGLCLNVGGEARSFYFLVMPVVRAQQPALANFKRINRRCSELLLFIPAVGDLRRSGKQGMS